jgi:1,3-beta-glucanosyltransferase GAS1
MDNFQQFDNTAGFFVGNEVLNVSKWSTVSAKQERCSLTNPTVEDAPAAPFLLAAAVDLKSYRDAKGYRKIPIGYSATDTAVLRPMLQDYLVCRPNVTERLDFYALNSYEWCGSTPTFQTSGYVGLQALAENYPVPIFLSETGCNTVPPRTFDDQAAIFGPDMVNTWSGAIIYEWIQELNQYGLIEYGPSLGAEVNQGSVVVQG